MTDKYGKKHDISRDWYYVFKCLLGVLEHKTLYGGSLYQGIQNCAFPQVGHMLSKGLRRPPSGFVPHKLQDLCKQEVKVQVE
jgi:hypothetical protein